MLSRAAQTVISFPLVDATSSSGTRKTAAAGIVSQISKDGGAFANTTNAPAEIGSSGRYALTVTAAEMAAGLVHVKVEATGCIPHDWMVQPFGLLDGVVTGAGSTTTSITATGQAETAADHWKNAFLRFTSGGLAGQVRQITGYATGVFTTAAFSAAPAAGDRYVIVNA